MLTAEVTKQFYNDTIARIGPQPLLTAVNIDSATALTQFRDTIGNTPSIAFLDAHWQSDSALDRELAEFVHWPVKPVIMIHDFKVPGKNFGFDQWDGHDYDLNFYHPHFDRIYGVGKWAPRYNEQAEGAYRGVIILEPIK